MAGLLSGIGQVLAGGVAGGAKAAGESFVEQAKQEALAAREENMLRIQNLFAKAGREETQKFQAGESKLGRESAQKLSDQAQLGANIRQTESLTSTENLAAVKAQEAEALVRLTHDLGETERGTIKKNYDELLLIFPENEAKAMLAASLTKELKEETRTKLSSWTNMYITNMKPISVEGPPTPQQKIDIAQEVTDILGYSPKDLFPTKGTGKAGIPAVSPIDLYEQRKKKPAVAPVETKTPNTSVDAWEKQGLLKGLLR